MHLALCLDCLKEASFFFLLAGDKTESVSALRAESFINHNSEETLKIKEDVGIHTHILTFKMFYGMCVCAFVHMCV